jgi:serpin B
VTHDITGTPVGRRTLLGALAALGALPLAGCAAGHADGPTDDPTGGTVPGVLTASGVRREVPAAGSPVGATVTGMTEFGHKLAAATAAPGTNWVCSPLSIAAAFAMARVGARGKTAASLDRFFGFPAAGRDDAFNAITQAVVTTDVPPPLKQSTRTMDDPTDPPVVSIGNQLFPDRRCTVEPAFLATLAAKYGAGVQVVDFAAPAALRAIDTWADTHTAGRIKKVFDSLDPSTGLVIANTVYLRAGWQELFEAITDAPFTRGDGTAVTVSTMSVGGRFPFAARDGWKALKLPFAESTSLSMWLLLPPAGGAPVDMLGTDRLAEVGAALTTQPVAVAVPKWKFTTGIDLAEALVGMGLTDVFGTGDFTGISAQLGGISDAVHKATITVDEFGTEAAAVTALAFPMSGMAAGAEFTADRPFAFAIVDSDDHVPLFSGIVADPTAS